jgi:hypothetical protein
VGVGGGGTAGRVKAPRRRPQIQILSRTQISSFTPNKQNCREREREREREKQNNPNELCPEFSLVLGIAWFSVVLLVLSRTKKVLIFWVLLRLVILSWHGFLYVLSGSPVPQKKET